MEDMEVDDYKSTNGLFSKDYDTNLLNNIGETTPPGKEDNTEDSSPKFDSRTFARNTHVNNIARPTSSELGLSSKSDLQREVASELPESPVDNLSSANSHLPIPSKLPTKDPTKESNGRSDYESVNKEQNTTTDKRYSEAEVQSLLETARREQSEKWSLEKKGIEEIAESKAQEILSLKAECQSLVEMGSVSKDEPVEGNLKVLMSLNSEFGERLMTSKRKNEELLKKQIAKLSSDNTSFHKEIDVMHSAMSDLHKRYDRAREIINQMRTREDELEEKIRGYMADLNTSEENIKTLKEECENKLEAANSKIEMTSVEYEKEKVMMEAQIKRLELESKSWHSKFLDKESSERELILICDSLMGVKQEGGMDDS